MDSPRSPSTTISNKSFDDIVVETSAIDHQKNVLYRHLIFLKNRDFNLLVQAGLMDQLVKILEDDERKREILIPHITVTHSNTNTDNSDEDEPIPKKIKASHVTTYDITMQTD